ncbi:MAG TPA: hypothetical protein VFZ16_15445 [Hyphomicrobiaceae bacterium]|nr:hypothetical protein [Hyphomicrobiaceae bacterium]
MQQQADGSRSPDLLLNLSTGIEHYAAVRQYEEYNAERRIPGSLSMTTVTVKF